MKILVYLAMQLLSGARTLVLQGVAGSAKTTTNCRIVMAFTCILPRGTKIYWVAEQNAPLIDASKHCTPRLRYCETPLEPQPNANSFQPLSLRQPLFLIFGSAAVNVNSSNWSIRAND